MMILAGILYVVGGALLAVTVLSLLLWKSWWVRIFDFPRMQIAVLLLVMFVAGWLVLDRETPGNALFLAALAVAFGYQAFRIYAYTPLKRVQVVQAFDCPQDQRLRVLIANVLMPNRQAETFLRLIWEHDPDLVLAVETDAWWDAQLAVLDAEYPHSVKRPMDNTYGMHLFSRLPLDNPEVRHLLQDEVPSIYTALRLPGGTWIDFYGVHPRPPRPAQDTEQRDAELLLVGREIRRNRRPAIVAGDLNDVAWSRTTSLFLRLSGLLDPRIGRAPYSTFHARYPGLRWPLDHVFHDASFSLVTMRRLEYFGSDHFPVLVTLCHQPGGVPAQEATESEVGDQQQAQREIRQGLRASDEQ